MHNHKPHDLCDTREPEPSTYQTGSTRPPKSYGGIIAVLLVVVIFLSGINGVLSLMNIKLFRQLQNTGSADAGVIFSGEKTTAAIGGADPACIDLPFGFTGCALSSFDQLMYVLPQGIYVTAVTPEGYADKLGIRPGDVLIQLGEHPLTDTDTLSSALQTLSAGEPVQAVFVRADTQVTLELTVGDHYGTDF